METKPYLPDFLPKARVLITVKTYPLPSGEYDELVCTAGLFEGEKWIRIYPIPFRSWDADKRFKKFHWIEVDLERNKKDFRPESYRLADGIDAEVKIVSELDTSMNWSHRSRYVLENVHTSMNELIADAHGDKVTSLATLKPKQIVDFVVEETEREWKQEWLDQVNQISIFNYGDNLSPQERNIVDKLPYDYYYKFLTEGDPNPRKLRVEDWEIGALYRNCLKRSGGDEKRANEQVIDRYLREFTQEKDLHFFLGTTKKYHYLSKNPFMIIGVYYPPKNQFMSF